MLAYRRSLTISIEIRGRKWRKALGFGQWL